MFVCFSVLFLITAIFLNPHLHRTSRKYLQKASLKTQILNYIQYKNKIKTKKVSRNMFDLVLHYISPGFMCLIHGYLSVSSSHLPICVPRGLEISFALSVQKICSFSTKTAPHPNPLEYCNSHNYLRIAMHTLFFFFFASRKICKRDHMPEGFLILSICIS